MKGHRNYDRMLGTLYGVAVGDALGGPVEFMSRKDILTAYDGKEIRDMMGGGWLALKPGETTDDTAMTVCVMKGIMEQPELPVGAIGRHFIEWLHTGPKDVGNTCALAIRTAERLLKDAPKGDNDPVSAHVTWLKAANETGMKLTGRAGGNGALMRVAPVGVAYTAGTNVDGMAGSVSEMTHADHLSSIICMAYCTAISAYVFGIDNVGDAFLERIAERYEFPSPDDDRQQPPKPTGWVKDSMECAYYAFRATKDFEDAVVMAVNMGGDADTIGAITGGLAGARYGFDAIPRRWIDELYDKSLHDTIHDFVEFVLDGKVDDAYKEWMEHGFSET